MADFVDDVDAVAASPGRTAGADRPFDGRLHRAAVPREAATARRVSSGVGTRRAEWPRHQLRVMRSHPWCRYAPTSARRPEIIFRPPLTRETLFSASTPEDVVDACADRVESESTRALWFDAMFRLPKPSRVAAPDARSRVASTTDASPPHEVHATARAYRTEAELFPMGHNMMLEPGWPARSRANRELAGRTGGFELRNSASGVMSLRTPREGRLSPPRRTRPLQGVGIAAPADAALQTRVAEAVTRMRDGDVGLRDRRKDEWIDGEPGDRRCGGMTTQRSRIEIKIAKTAT